tara:strand:+ start:143 stop:382 length:240 start_codon:yes stop_codon:yes gene_type:complete
VALQGLLNKFIINLLKIKIMEPVLLAIGPWQIALAAAAILLLFGGKKIPELMKGLGKGMKEFKKAKKDISNEIEDKDEK